MTPLAWIAVGLLGGVAAAARFVLDYEVSARFGSAFPLGILAVNLLGAFALGLVAGTTLSGATATVVSGGVIGSFTTFSTWILDTDKLGTAGRADLAWANLAISLLAGLGAVALGHWLGAAL